MDGQKDHGICLFMVNWNQGFNSVSNFIGLWKNSQFDFPQPLGWSSREPDVNITYTSGFFPPALSSSGKSHNNNRSTNKKKKNDTYKRLTWKIIIVRPVIRTLIPSSKTQGSEYSYWSTTLYEINYNESTWYFSDVCRWWYLSTHYPHRRTRTTRIKGRHNFCSVQWLYKFIYAHMKGI